jgi:membrane-associated phospholipid phosphatase
VAALIFFYFCFDKEFGKFVGKNIAIGLVLNPLIKNIFVRRRPYFDNPGIKILNKVDESADAYDIAAQGFSFPSGHSMYSAIIYGSLPFYYSIKRDDIKEKGIEEKRWLKITSLILAFTIPLLVGISRFSLGAHYPTDVFSGWIIGAAVMLLMTFVQKKLFTSKKREYIINICVFVLSLAGLFYCKSNDYYTGIGVMAGVYFGGMFEERFVNFENPDSALEAIIRLAGAFVIYFGLNFLIKLPFSEEFMDSATMGAFLFRFIRYAIVSFVVLAVYPLVFKRLNMLLSKHSRSTEG